VETLWTQRQTAEHLAISVRALETWRYDNAGPPYIRVGGQIRYRPADVAAWLDAQTHNRA
jgi:predicted DNA-binding transcriptional regulator AlpA